MADKGTTAAEVTAAGEVSPPRRGIWLDLGCGSKKKRGWIGMDVRDVPGVDIVHDVEDIPWPLETNSCSLIMMSHLWEHLKPWKVFTVMAEMWRILRADGQLQITTPHGTSHGYLQDPSHMNPAVEQTWEYFDPACNLYKVYEPPPWHIVRLLHQEYGNMLVVMEPKKDRAQSRASGGGSIPIPRDKEAFLTPSAVIDAYHRIEYNLRTPESLPRWMGAAVDKTPIDLWNYHELIWEVKPKVIVETGTANGGSALFFAKMMDLTGGGTVISIDIDDGEVPEKVNISRTNSGVRPKHPRVKYLRGSSLDSKIALKVLSTINDLPAKDRSPVMVVLDSDHRRPHVYGELAIYSPLVTLGSYLVVEDGNVNGHPVYAEYGAGPYEAILAWLQDHPEFEVDSAREERFLYTYNPLGWLKRIEPKRARKRGPRHVS